MNIETIELIEEELKKEREIIEQKNKEEYEAGPHKMFAMDEWVTNGEIIGTVQRVIAGGYINVSIKNNHGGLLCQTRSDGFTLLDEDRRRYYTGKRELKVILTGEDIEEFYRAYASLTNVNPSKTKDKIAKAVSNIRPSFNPQ